MKTFTSFPGSMTVNVKFSKMKVLENVQPIKISHNFLFDSSEVDVESNDEEHSTDILQSLNDSNEESEKDSDTEVRR